MNPDIAVIGGAGHVGLPLSIMLASAGKKVAIVDVDEEALDIVRGGQMPFIEPGAEDLLRKALDAGNLLASSDKSLISLAEVVILVIGTPVDEHMNPNAKELLDVTTSYLPNLRNGQLLVLRSTVFPGVTRQVATVIEDSGKSLDVAFCPERIAEHNAVEELSSLPQLVSGITEAAVDRATGLFEILTKVLRVGSPEEAELAKLFTNTWRYIKFAAANQFYMMASASGLDFEEIRRVVRQDYPRAADLPSAGLAAGPCLLKDTMQLSAFMDNNFILGSAAISVNEGLPLFMVRQIEKRYELENMRIGLLGMAFKAGSDDIRSSLSYKLKKILSFRAKEVMTSDQYVSTKTDADLYPLEEVLANCDLLIIGAPHANYRKLGVDLPIFDIWGQSLDPGVFR